MHRRLFLILVVLCHGVSAAEVRGVHANSSGDGTRLVFDVSAAVQYSVFRMDSPERLVVDFKGASARRVLNLEPLPFAITNLRQFIRDDKGLRVIVELRTASRVEAHLLQPSNGAGYRVDVQLTPNAAVMARAAPPASARPPRAAVVLPAASAAPAASMSKVSPASVPVLASANAVTNVPAGDAPAPRSRRELVIAVDAGHGGQDVGAIGPSGVYEKDVVLGVARELARLIGAQPGMRAVLTRDGDYFLPLRVRMERARAMRADLFVSVHADAVYDRRVRGSSVYVLSQRGASSEAAKWLAANENAADLVGGVSLDDKDHMLKSVLLDLSQAASMDASIDLANAVLRALGKVGTIHRNRVQHAGFMVLKSPDVPSILVETAFISNPLEEQRLRSESYRKTLARAIFNGVASYTGSRIPAPLAVESVADARRHRVSAGETLSGIADRYAVSINTLKLANSMESETVRTGALLRIP